MRELTTALVDADSATLDRLTAADLSYGHSAGKIETKKEFIHALASGAADFKSIDISGESIKVTGNTAIVRHQLVGVIVDKGTESPVKLHVLLVWVEEKGVWKLLARQAVKIP
jgi:hypothetical protein